MHSDDQLGTAAEIAHGLDPKRINGCGADHHQKGDEGHDSNDGAAQLLPQLPLGKP
jgi:hypothetical protein